MQAAGIRKPDRWRLERLQDSTLTQDNAPARGYTRSYGLAIAIRPFWLIGAALAILGALGGASAQAPEGGAPNFWDLQRRTDRPDLGAIRVIRFITDDEYPPFGFLGQDGNLAGFNVDLARAVCEELKVACTIQARRFDSILDVVARGEADAAIASIAITPATRARVDFTRPYYRTPARFVSRRDARTPQDVRPETLAGARVGVVAGTAHEAYLARHFPLAERVTYPNLAALLAAVRSGDEPLGFGDGVTLAVWLNGADSADCCAFRGGPWLDGAFFGEGVGVAVRRDNAVLRRAIDFALLRIAQQGGYTELYLKHFPVGFF
ncbi:MAG: transporter substrate-binding protein [Hyphomicrobiales bacterium]|nr:transporter substrate-binding protein [Hyphomicrobiales bacterium]